MSSYPQTQTNTTEAVFSGFSTIYTHIVISNYNQFQRHVSNMFFFYNLMIINPYPIALIIFVNRKIILKKSCENDYSLLLTMWEHIAEKPFPVQTDRPHTN